MSILEKLLTAAVNVRVLAARVRLVDTNGVGVVAAQDIRGHRARADSSSRANACSFSVRHYLYAKPTTKYGAN